jgi:hypothetical protein
LISHLASLALFIREKEWLAWWVEVGFDCIDNVAEDGFEDGCWDSIMDGSDDGFQLRLGAAELPGAKDGFEDGKDDGIVDGKDDGFVDGIMDGKDGGFIDGIVDGSVTVS